MSSILTRPARLWPLALSALFVWPLCYLLPSIYRNARFSLGGTQTVGWYSNFGPYYDARGRPYFLYADSVGGVTYGGRGLYDDDTSEIYFRQAGDPIGVTYLTRKPRGLNHGASPI